MSLTTYKFYNGEFNSSVASRTDDQFSDIDANTFIHYIKKNGCDIVHDMNHCIYCIYPSTNFTRSYLHGMSWAYPVDDYKNHMVTNQYCIDCEYCSECINCDSCFRCKLCKHCTRCRHCNDCENSTECDLCTRCDNSKHCYSCRDCVNCMVCDSARKCSFCSNAIDSKSCDDSFNCCNCNSCKNVKHEFRTKKSESQ